MKSQENERNIVNEHQISQQNMPFCIWIQLCIELGKIHYKLFICLLLMLDFLCHRELCIILVLTKSQECSLTTFCFSPYIKLSYMFCAINFINLKVVTLMDFYIAKNLIVIANEPLSLGLCCSIYCLKILFKEVIVILLRASFICVL